MTSADRPDDPGRQTENDGVIRINYEWTATTPSTAVIETVAVASDREPTRIGPLYEVIDPDALDELVRSTGNEQIQRQVTVTFEFAGQTVTVHGGGEVIVRPVDRRSEAQE